MSIRPIYFFRFLKEILINNPVQKISAIGFAILIWTFAPSQNKTELSQMQIFVPVSYVNTPQNLETGNKIYRDIAVTNLDWVVKQQQKNGWFENANFKPNEYPNTWGSPISSRTSHPKASRCDHRPTILFHSLRLLFEPRQWYRPDYRL